MTAISGVRVISATISIHIPRVGDDLGSLPDIAPWELISIHIPRVGDDAEIR